VAFQEVSLENQTYKELETDFFDEAPVSMINLENSPKPKIFSENQNSV
jgi:hypothetical protein